MEVRFSWSSITLINSFGVSSSFALWEVKHSEGEEGDKSQIEEFILLEFERDTFDVALKGAKAKDRLLDPIVYSPKLPAIATVKSFPSSSVVQVNYLYPLAWLRW